MNQPLVALLIAPDKNMRRNIETGKKKISIRLNYRDYRVGQTIMLCCHLVPWVVQADITEVRHCTLKEVTEVEYQGDGFSCIAGMIKGLRTFYPNVGLDSPVTVIKWGHVRGKLVSSK